MGLGLRVLGEGQSLDLHITHNLVPLAKELGVYEAVWRGGLFVEETIITSKGDRLIWSVSDDQLALIEQAIVRIESGDFSTPDPANGWGTSQSFLGALNEIRDFCNDNQLVFDVSISK